MTTREIVVVNRLGLHARAAAKVVQCLGAFAARVTLAFRGREVNAKSIMGLMLLAAPQGAVIRATADGEDAAAALDALAALFAERFGEPD
jgi:phosphocarrier protein